VKVALTDGSTAAPTCVANAGSTGETNNLNLGKCSTASGSSPSMDSVHRIELVPVAEVASPLVGSPRIIARWQFWRS
jgi:hypothetical protein